MNARICIIAILIAVLEGSAQCTAKDIFVDNVAGNDLFDGSRPESLGERIGPFQTIVRALRSAMAGDRIVLAKTDEPYRESISLVGSWHSGDVGQPFVLDGNGATLDGSRPIAETEWVFYSGDVFRTPAPRMQFQRLFLDGEPIAQKRSATTAVNPIDLQPLEWTAADGWIYFCVESGKLPRDYALSVSVLPTGITAYKVEGLAIADLTVRGFAIDGIHLNDAVGPTILDAVSCQGNGRSGVAATGVTRAELRECVLTHNGRSQLYLADFAEVDLFETELSDGGSPSWQIDRDALLRIDGRQIDESRPQAQ